LENTINALLDFLLKGFMDELFAMDEERGSEAGGKRANRRENCSRLKHGT
jgi:hypothetical protein